MFYPSLNLARMERDLMKPILFLLNKRDSIKSGTTTSTLMLACHRKGHPVFATDIVHLKASSSTSLFADAYQLAVRDRVDSTAMLSAQISKARSEVVDLREMQAIIVRTTPGKDIDRAWAHRLSLEIMRLASESGVRVVNDPIGLQRASSKLYTVCLPEHLVPRTMVCHSLDCVQDFAKDLDCRFVIKPLLGSQGRDVFFLDRYDSINTKQIVDILGRTGYLVVQEFIPEASEGDIRVLTLGDSLITANGKFLGIRRTPAIGELRSNVSLGGSASVIELTDQQVQVCREVAGYLNQDGIRFSGLDLIGNRIVEVNVYSPSGLQEIDAIAGGAKVSGTVAQELIDGDFSRIEATH